MEYIPLDVISRLYLFMEPESHINFSSTCRTFYNRADNQYYWQKVVCKKYNYLYLENHQADIHIYDYDFKKLWLDHNKRTRTLIIKKKFDLNHSERISTDPIYFQGYYWNIIIDTFGNPNIFMTEPHISAYLNCTNNYKNIWSINANFTIRLLLPNNKKIRWERENWEFHHNAPNWGTHLLCPHSKLNNVKEIEIEVIMTVSWFMIEVVDTRGLYKYSGRSIICDLFCRHISVRGNLQIKDLRSLIAGKDDILWVFDGVYEYLPVTRLEDDEEKICNIFNSKCHSIRIWVQEKKLGENKGLVPYFIKTDDRLSAIHFYFEDTSKKEIEKKLGMTLYSYTDTSRILSTTEYKKVKPEFSPRKNILQMLEYMGGISPYLSRKISFEHPHKSPRELFEYCMDRHLDYCCDCCGKYEFTGIRYKCNICDNYDLCHDCFMNKNEFKHRYIYKEGRYKQLFTRSDERCHVKNHEMTPIRPLWQV